jgi:predicted anti-sigma-YlaC factor YlaD
MNPRQSLSSAFACTVAFVLAGCSSVNHIAVNKLADALASGGTTFASDNDPQLIRDATPFTLKLMESLLAENPRHADLLFAASSGFTQYSYAFIQQDADEMETRDVAGANQLRIRARGLYLRGRDYGMRGLELTHSGLSVKLRENPHSAVKMCRNEDVPLMYWTAASWAAAIALSKDDPGLIAELPLAEALMDRALELNESYDSGAIHGFFITYEMARPGGSGDPAIRSRQHFDRAMNLTQGGQASPLVAYAEAVSVQKQDRVEFEKLLKQALAIDVNARPEWRLLNLVMQRRARWLLARIDDLFLPVDTANPPAAP